MRSINLKVPKCHPKVPLRPYQGALLITSQCQLEMYENVYDSFNVYLVHELSRV
jgi:hypothetical protein